MNGTFKISKVAKAVRVAIEFPNYIPGDYDQALLKEQSPNLPWR